MQLQPGQNTSLPGTQLSVTISSIPAIAGMELDCSAFMLNDNGKVANDSGMVFYGKSSSSDGSVKLSAAQKCFDIDLSNADNALQRIAIALTIDKGLNRNQRFGMLNKVEMTCQCGGQSMSFLIDTRPMAETALILADVYRRNGVWKLRAVGQGFVGGLAALADHFGVDITDNPDAPASAPTPERVESPGLSPPPGPSPVPSVAPQPAPATPPIRLSKITLEKSKPISLEKKGSSFGEILVNLNWTKKVVNKGFFGGLGGNKGIDLDLGCMIEHRNGFKGVVQALGNTFGSLGVAPFAMLMGDDRTGASAQGEFLKINGQHWAEIKRVLIFAFIYEGVPNWAQAGAGITISTPGQPELSALLDSHSDRHTMCAVAMLENDGDGLKVTKLVEYFSGHKEMDDRFRFGFSWRAGSK